MIPFIIADPSVICIPGTKKKGQYTCKSDSVFLSFENVIEFILLSIVEYINTT